MDFVEPFPPFRPSIQATSDAPSSQRFDGEAWLKTLKHLPNFPPNSLKCRSVSPAQETEHSQELQSSRWSSGSSAGNTNCLHLLKTSRSNSFFQHVADILGIGWAWASSNIKRQIYQFAVKKMVQMSATFSLLPELLCWQLEISVL